MKKLLLTGGSGFIGSNIKPILEQWYKVDAPSRTELDLKNTEQVAEYIQSGKFDIIIHSANPNPAKNHEDASQNMLEDSMRSFLNIYRVRDMAEKIIYFGSGAEYDKTREIIMAREEEVKEHLPKDAYGFAKYMMNEMAGQSENVYNLRLFGCYGNGDHESKFITHAVRCCLKGMPITIRQDCIFDYLYVTDVADIVHRAIECSLSYHDYNVCSAQPVRLSEIAQKIRLYMNASCSPVKILMGGMNKQYTASNERIKQIMENGWRPVPIEEGIRRQILYERSVYSQ